MLFAVFCKVMFSIQVNDLSDRREDLAAGKQRWIALLPESLGILVCTLTILVGFLTVVVASDSPSTLSAYGATTLLALAYSARPVRFKERGILGPIAYSASATIVFVLVPWTWLSSNTLLLGFLCIAVVADKWIQLHFHQILDFEADRSSGTRTFVVGIGLENARLVLRGAAFVASLCLLGLFGYVLDVLKPHGARQIVVGLTAVAVLACCAAYVRVGRRRAQGATALVNELPWFYLALTYLLFCALPPVGFLLLALDEPLIWPVAVLSGLSSLGLSVQMLRYEYR
jgi:1,4-dihydroxy-2-naphthoate octaprenyltransferase